MVIRDLIMILEHRRPLLIWYILTSLVKLIIDIPWSLLKWCLDVRSARLYGQFSLDKTLTLQAGATVLKFGHHRNQIKLHFWNQETSYSNALYSVSVPNSIDYLFKLKDYVAQTPQNTNMRSEKSTWKFEKSNCTAYVCLCQSMNQLYNNQKNGPTFSTPWQWPESGIQI